MGSSNRATVVANDPGKDVFQLHALASRRLPTSQSLATDEGSDAPSEKAILT